MTQTFLTPAQIDSGLQFTSGAKWAGPTLTVSIPDATSVWDPMYNGRTDGEPFDPAYRGVSAAQAANYLQSVKMWDSYIALSIVQVDDHATPGDFRVAFTNVNKYSPDAAGYAYSPPLAGQMAGPSSGDTWLPSQNEGLTYAQGTYGFQVLLHEMGHALGLKHPFADPVLANGPNGENYGTYIYTVMSYTGPDYKHNITVTPNSVSDPNDVTVDLTPMVMDIQAIQDLYGADPTTAVGNDVYRFTDAQFDGRRSIYDAGGVDTFDFSQISRASNIDLRPGAYSDIAYFSKEAQEAAIYAANPQVAQDSGFRTFVHNSLNDPNRPDYEWTKNLGIAFSTTIENVIGTAFADTIIGNSVANVITGGAGADVITGNGGNDIFKDSAANLNGDRVTDFINADVITVTDAVAALLNLTYTGSLLSFSLATAPAVAYSMTLNGASGPVLQRFDVSGGVDIYFGLTPPPAVYGIAVAPASGPEGNTGAGTVLTYTVTRTGDTAAATVDVGFGGTATGPGVAGADYTITGLTNGKLAFTAGSASASFTVTTVPDTTPEPDETVVATISNATAGGMIGTASVTGTIIDDDAAPPPAQSYSIAVSPPSAPEGNSGTGNPFTFTVTRTDTTSVGSVTIGFGGTATAPGTSGADYAVAGLANGLLSFAAGAAMASFTVTTTPDTVVEPDETVIAAVYGAGDTIAASATVTIKNDDVAPPADTTADAGDPAHLVVDGTRNGLVDLYESHIASFAVTGLDADATAVATFTDGIHVATTNVAVNGTFTIDLSGLDGTVSSSLAIMDMVGNKASATGNAVHVDVDAYVGLFGAIVTDTAGLAGKVFELYEGLLGRAPDPTGYEFWLDSLAHGSTLRDVADGLLASGEYAGRNGPPAAETNAGFVDELYHVVLGRDGDSSGRGFWIDALASGTTRSEVALDFALSSENRGQDAAVLSKGVFAPDPVASDVARLYYAVLERAPDTSGLSFWTDAIKGGTTTAAVAQSFINSAEHTGQFGPQSDAIFINHIYQGAVGHAADPAALAQAQGALAAGQSRGTVALGIADSPEANAHHLVEIEQGWHAM